MIVKIYFYPSISNKMDIKLGIGKQYHNHWLAQIVDFKWLPPLTSPLCAGTEFSRDFVTLVFTNTLGS